jgi:glutathione S-transferase
MTTEIHGTENHSSIPVPPKEKARRKFVKNFITLEAQLGDGAFLLGKHMTIADPYLFVMLVWAPKHGIEAPRGRKLISLC